MGSDSLQLRKFFTGLKLMIFFQISPENDPSNNWTLFKVDNPGIQNPGSDQMSSIQEEEFDSLFSSPSLKTSHSSSHKELCTCLGGQISDQDLTVKPKGHRLLTRMSSYPKCHPDYDPHRYDLKPHEAITDLKVHTYFDFEIISVLQILTL